MNPADRQDGPRCVTCSDEARAGRVVALLPDGRARVEIGALVEEVSVELVEAAVGDVVLVHGGVAIGTLA
jgi:hydrogenase expression/formation protein HypC